VDVRKVGPQQDHGRRQDMDARLLSSSLLASDREKNMNQSSGDRRGICVCAKEEIGSHVRQPLVLKSWSSRLRLEDHARFVTNSSLKLPSRRSSALLRYSVHRAFRSSGFHGWSWRVLTWTRRPRLDPRSIYNHCLHRSERLDALAVAAYSHADRTASISNNVTE
jgi:hypothetical protein